MITYEGIKVNNFRTEGFATSLTKPLTIKIEAGTFIRKTAEGEDDIILEFPEISFDVEPDPEIPVGYDVYLLDGENEDGLNIEVEKTELGQGVIQVYEEETPLLHALVSFVVPPGTESLEDMEINVRTVKLADDGKAGGTDENKAET